MGLAMRCLFGLLQQAACGRCRYGQPYGSYPPQQPGGGYPGYPQPAPAPAGYGGYAPAAVVDPAAAAYAAYGAYGQPPPHQAPPQQQSKWTVSPLPLTEQTSRAWKQLLHQGGRPALPQHCCTARAAGGLFSPLMHAHILWSGRGDNSPFPLYWQPDRERAADCVVLRV